MKNRRIYLDYAATTPVDKEILREMLPYFNEKFGNAMSIHSFGQEALSAVDKARERVAKFFKTTPYEIIFTSGATESNNLAVKGVVKSYYSRDKKAKKPHIITTAFEHHCVLHACKSLEKEGLVEVTYVRPGKDGIIKVADIKRSIRSNTILISVMHVNNEIGTVQPIAKIGKMIKTINNKQRTKNNRFKILFHTDATQAINHFDCNADKLGVDLLSMSAHKIYGPKGIGMLYIRKGTPIRQIKHGGDQEYKMRAGTHNVPGIVGLGKAISMINEQGSMNNKIQKLRDYLIKRVLKEIPNTKLNGSKMKRSPNNANFSFRDIEGEGLILSMDMEGVACSTGSACSSGALTPSHVLLSIGLKPEDAHGSLRMTLGKYTTKKDIDIAAGKLKEVVGRLRKISGHVLKDYYKKH